MSSRSSADEPVPRGKLVARAVALGALHGPAELLPISSSGHVALLPWLLDWDAEALDAELRKAFEVVLHAGTAAALLITLRNEVGEVLHRLDRRGLALIALSFAPPALAGYVLERPIESRLGTPSTIAVGLLAGSLAMAVADRRPQVRSHQEAGARDAICLGAAQAAALIPGVSRGGATVTAARALAFTRPDANRLSRQAALPVIAGATLLKSLRLAQRGLPRAVAAPFAAGTLSSFASTLGSTWLIRRVERDRSLLPYAAYRVVLALAVLRKASRSAR